MSVLVRHSIDGDVKYVWFIGSDTGKDHILVLETADKASGHHLHKRGQGGSSPSAPGLLTLVLDFNYGTQHTIGKLRISATTSSRPVTLESAVAEIRQIARVPREKRTAEQKGKIDAYWRSLDNE